MKNEKKESNPCWKVCTLFWRMKSFVRTVTSAIMADSVPHSGLCNLHEPQLLCVGHNVHSCVTSQKGSLSRDRPQPWLADTEYRRLVSPLVSGLGWGLTLWVICATVGLNILSFPPALLCFPYCLYPESPSPNQSLGQEPQPQAQLLGNLTSVRYMVTCLEKVKVAQSCLTPCNPMDCSLPGSSVHGILQTRILEWVAIHFSRDLPDLGIKLRKPALQADSLSLQGSLLTYLRRC